MTLDKFFIDKEDTVLLIVDIQDKLAAVTAVDQFRYSFHVEIVAKFSR